MRRLVLPAIATAFGLAILIGLGIWQVERLAWKEALIARVTSRLDAPPVPAPAPADWAKLDLADLQYEPVTVTGHFDNAREIYVVQPLTEPKGRLGGLGYMVMTPLTTADGWTVYVNRGFVPTANKDPATRPGGQVEGETTVTGLLRQPYDRSWSAPADNAAKNEWFSRDPALYARASGLDPAKVAPYLIDARFDPSLAGGMPQGGETLVEFPNNHLQYAITWFGLAAALAGVFVAFARGRLRKDVPPPSV
jgi:surfeit locus 1 family protein